jgi:hypothetical protein
VIAVAALIAEGIGEPNPSALEWQGSIARNAHYRGVSMKNWWGGWRKGKEMGV